MTKLFMTILGLPALVCALTSGAPTLSKDEIDILISPRPIEDPDAPRSVSPVISAYFDTDLSCLYVTISNAGTLVDVYIENTTTRETAAYQIPGSGSSIMPISGTSGCWSITFTLSTGDVYCGNFAL